VPAPTVLTMNGYIKVVVEKTDLADRMNEIVAEYDKYLQ
jgi:hypothetical protein